MTQQLNQKEKMSTVAERVKKMIVEHLFIEETKVTDNARFNDDLGADSLVDEELVMAIKEEFGVDISDAAAPEFHTVKDLIDYIEKQIGSSHG
jgi:acyl carrier protein